MCEGLRSDGRLVVGDSVGSAERAPDRCDRKVELLTSRCHLRSSCPTKSGMQARRRDGEAESPTNLASSYQQTSTASIESRLAGSALLRSE